ncbi:Maf1 regulator-domain-containing protein [Vararia minispora EC-137]|uniref:Maf1 regulator-domain-containing protein n=1 Tax=Vararia minispora EC-137 TaxID=1314806 RepID=A0ACB8QU51_9AGAM|nr:Maf1 regulator-domain-containing protein [Vararia minispora EC-137]
MALNHDGPECSVHTRIEAYSCKNVKRDKRLFRTLEAAYADDVSNSPPFVVGVDRDGDATPFGPFDKHSSRKTLYLLIALLNAAFPDHEFSDVRPAHFNREQSGASVLSALSTTLLSPHRAGLRAPRTYSSYPPSSTDLFPLSLPTSSSPPPPHPLPHPRRRHRPPRFDDDESDVASVPASDSDNDSAPEDTFAFDDYDVDEGAPPLRSTAHAPPTPAGRLDPRPRALLWSSHWFFLNRKLKRILFVSVCARARGAARWTGDDDDDDDEGYGSSAERPTISGERFLGWEGAVGAGARAMGLRASV